MNRWRFSSEKWEAEKGINGNLRIFKNNIEVKNSLEALTIYWRSQKGNDLRQKPIFMDGNEYDQKW